MNLARSIALRYRNRGVALDDLEQVAYEALVTAARKYDPSTGNLFASYASPTIRGEIRHYFRDVGWSVKPPRFVQELQGRIRRAEGELLSSLGRSPRPSEIAAHLDVTVDEVIESLAASGCFAPTSLDRPVGFDTQMTLGEQLAADDRGHGAVEAAVVLEPAMRTLSQRDRRILRLRFEKGWKQREIALDLGVTQMQVSRLITRILRDLRGQLRSVGVTSAE